MKKIIKPIGLGILISFYIVLVQTFMTAYLHPTKSVLVTINSYGEAHIEFILILITLPFVILFIYDSLQ